MTEMTNGKNALSVDNRTEAENIRDAAKEDTGSQKFLKFRKGYTPTGNLFRLVSSTLFTRPVG